MAINFGQTLPITIPQLSDQANIVTALTGLYYGTLNGATATESQLYAEPNAIGGYLQQLKTDKVNKAGNMTQFQQTTTASDFRGLISGTTGTGNLVFASTPTIATPIITSPTINTSIILPGSTSGNVTLTVPAVSGTTAISFPATSGTVVTTGDSGTVTSTMIADGTIVNADVNANAAIAYSKLNLSTSIANSDISTTASIAYSKLNLTGNIVNADIKSDAAIAYSKLNLATSITNSDVSATAAIAKTKIAGTAITATDTGTVTNTILQNSTITIGSTSISLGGSSTALAGVTSINSFTIPTFATGASLVSTNSTSTISASTTGNAATATAIAGAQSANTVYAGPSSGLAAIATFRGLVAEDIPNLDASKITTGTISSSRIPTLNQNTTGNAATATSLAGGSAGQIPYQSATGTTQFVDSTGAVSGYVLKYNGSASPSWANPATLAAVDVAVRADNITGGNSTTLLGSIPYQSDVNTTTLLSPNTTTTKKFLRQTGTGTNGAFPAWDTLVNGDIPSALTGKTYNALSLTSATTGFTIAGGTTSKTLTVSDNATVSGNNTGDQTITLTGDVTGSGTGSFATTLSATGVTTGTYKSVTVDAKGRITGGTNPTSLAGYGITDAATSTHVHGNITNDGKIGSTSGLIIKTGTAGTLTTLAAGTSGQFLQYDGNWATPPTYSLPTATVGTSTTGTLGGVKVDGTTVTISNGVISAAPQYTLPKASNAALGGIELVSDTVQTTTVSTPSSTGTTGKVYAVQLNSSDQAVVSVPWTGTVTSVGIAVPAELTASSAITSSGTITIGYATGRSIPLTTDTAKGVTAYGWGDHSGAGYLTSSSTLDATKLSGTATISTTGNAATSTSATSYTYYAATGSASASSTSRRKIFVSSGTPTGAEAGDLWFW